jgi:hypothetical protein
MPRLLLSAYERSCQEFRRSTRNDEVVLQRIVNGLSLFIMSVRLFSNLSLTLLSPFAMPFSCISAESVPVSTACFEGTMTLSYAFAEPNWRVRQEPALTTKAPALATSPPTISQPYIFRLRWSHELGGRPNANIGRACSVWRTGIGVRPR